MGKANIGNWLLTVGTVLGALGAANSHKSGKWVELESGQAVTGEYLLHPLVDEDGVEHLAAGTELDAAIRRDDPLPTADALLRQLDQLPALDGPIVDVAEINVIGVLQSADVLDDDLLGTGRPVHLRWGSMR